MMNERARNKKKEIKTKREKREKGAAFFRVLFFFSFEMKEKMKN